MNRFVTAGLRRAATMALKVLDDADAASQRPFAEPEILAPNLDSRRFGWTHYGVMIPDLPEPHRFLSVMSLIGATGALAFDTDHALPGPPRRTAAVVAGTAASHPGHFGAYLFGDDFTATSDGSDLRFGDDLRLTGRYPHFRLTGTPGGVDVDLKLTCSDTATWFFHSAVYKHLGLLTEYRGTLTATETIEVEGLCSFEYAACPSPYLARKSPLPPKSKAPLDYFVYQIVNLDAENQVLLSQYCFGGVPLFTIAYHRARHGRSTTFRDVRFDVTAVRDTPEATPYGIPMPVPAATRFQVRDDAGQVWLDLHATMDSPFTYGLGSGFVTGFSHQSRWRGAEVAGRGYLEYIDRRAR
ncbi:DUF6670 family protein [Mycolicibacterium brumae]|uniref:AttH domain-containing protein n=1 Tax=Mycolicibacterium brumae TaxID=85968 RepID=A0A2G5P6Y2_9MYCO|nr:DUF6670 family protein [Mycolicibacterium brumae]MCV7194026.1 hypothetical protein [Mycolicibacterium brumae]PIB73773.1 hypothetical protein CQY22_015440 [Mycolicibacterium brumae]RWA19939.1 hypothetical protein MBRU_16105 [Mycolicibacterium brumae DSM 44177]UWW09699.1 hypothetical protein L2Z93_002810 [Mycolicibacterium brumae]